MKLLLTSNGISNDSIKKSLFKLVGREDNLRIAFIPTAANFSGNDKSWLVNDMLRFSKIGHLDIVDISALKKDNFLPRLKLADIIVFGGGYVEYLMDKIIESGLFEELDELLKTKIYVGISAGSILTTKKSWISSQSFDKKPEDCKKLLGFFDFNIRPHFRANNIRVTEEQIEENTKKFPQEKIYALCDDSAIEIDGEQMRVISEGEYKIFN